MSEHDLTLLWNVPVGTDPMVASFLVHAVIEEAARVRGRIRLISVTVESHALRIRTSLPGQLPMVDREKDLEDIKKLFSEVARVAFAKTKNP